MQPVFLFGNELKSSIVVSRAREFFRAQLQLVSWVELILYAATVFSLCRIFFSRLTVFPLCVICPGPEGHLNGPGHLFRRLYGTRNLYLWGTSSFSPKRLWWIYTWAWIYKIGHVACVVGLCFHRSWLMGVCEGIWVELSQVELLELLQSHCSESMCQGLFALIKAASESDWRRSDTVGKPCQLQMEGRQLSESFSTFVRDQSFGVLEGVWSQGWQWTELAHSSCPFILANMAEEEVTRFVVRNGCGMYESCFAGDACTSLVLLVTMRLAEHPSPLGVELAASFDSTRENSPGLDTARTDRFIVLSSSSAWCRMAVLILWSALSC